MTTKEEIARWAKIGIEDGATHMLVVCDTFNYEDYPVFVMPVDNVRMKVDEYNGPNMQKVMEVYDLKVDLKKQLDALYAWNFRW